MDLYMRAFRALNIKEGKGDDFTRMLLSWVRKKMKSWDQHSPIPTPRERLTGSSGGIQCSIVGAKILDR